MKRQFAFIACLAALFAWAPAQAQELKFATQNPKGHPLVMGMEKFAEIVAAKSAGKLGFGGDCSEFTSCMDGRRLDARRFGHRADGMRSTKSRLAPAGGQRMADGRRRLG